MCDTFRPLLPTKAALVLDDAKYPASWQGEHVPGLASGKLALGNPNAQAVPVHDHRTIANVWAP
jgi:hypothetical protein